MSYIAGYTRYGRMEYHPSGRSCLRSPAIALGLWPNFGDDCSFETAREICRRAFDLGIIHFDRANNYGPPPGYSRPTSPPIATN
jgi:L-glyceraldehyde 3-phosphate reductase